MDRVTGGNMPATAWHNFMQAAHTDMNIKQIPGLPLHPVQIAERARIEELKRTQPQLARELAAGARGKSRLMSEKLKETLRKVAHSLRTAGGLPEPAADERSEGSPGRRAGTIPVEATTARIGTGAAH
jgi:penicillin-binding protein 1A